jgi:hypothetical protein
MVGTFDGNNVGLVDGAKVVGKFVGCMALGGIVSIAVAALVGSKVGDGALDGPTVGYSVNGPQYMGGTFSSGPQQPQKSFGYC